MRRTYELHFRKDQEETFRAITCSQSELLPQAAALLEQEGADQVEVREGGRSLFTLTD